MVLLNIKLDNFLVFNDFQLCTAYPKKIVGSTIREEHMANHENFRYKKVIVLMGANATGKTALGRILMGIFNFIARKESRAITTLIEDKERNASFEVDLAFDQNVLVRVSALFIAGATRSEDYDSDAIKVEVKTVKIRSADSYETCAERLSLISGSASENYIAELEKVPRLTWKFEYPLVGEGKQSVSQGIAPDKYCAVLEKVLKAMDPRITRVGRIKDVDNAFVIHFPHNIVILNDDNSIGFEKLSSGTAESVGVAEIITAMKLKLCNFYFCDEKFSHIHSDAERTFLSVFIELLGENDQLFFTSHNPALLDMDIPKHSFAFLRRDHSDNHVSCVFASDYLKKNTESLRNAVENDMFSASPDIGAIYELAEAEE